MMAITHLVVDKVRGVGIGCPLDDAGLSIFALEGERSLVGTERREKGGWLIGVLGPLARPAESGGGDLA